MRTTILAALLSMIVAAPTSAQVAVDSVQVEIYAAGDISVTISPRGFTGFVGDTVTFSAEVVDQVTGEPIEADVIWSSPDDGSGILIDSSGHVEFTARGSYTIRADVERIGGLVLYELQGTDIVPVGEVLELAVGESVQLCAYLTDASGDLIARSKPMCPFPGEAAQRARARSIPFRPMIERWGHLRRIVG